MLTQDIEKVLDQIGFDYGCLVEIILTTWNSDSTVNAAPMVIIRNQSKQFTIRPYKSSNTYENLKKNAQACANVTNNPVFFLTTTFKNEGLGLLSRPILRNILPIDGADAIINLKVFREENRDSDRPSFLCEPLSAKVIKPFPWAFSRGKLQTIEAVIYASHIEYLIINGRFNEAKAQISRFKICTEIVRKVSSSESIEVAVIDILEDLIKEWRAKG